MIDFKPKFHESPLTPSAPMMRTLQFAASLITSLFGNLVIAGMLGQPTPINYSPDLAQANFHLLQVLSASPAEEIFFNPINGIHQSVTVAVIDSGVDLNHPDFRDNLWTNLNEIPANQIDDDSNGFIDDIHGYNFASGTGDPSFEKTRENSSWQYAHGTHVAGLLNFVANHQRSFVRIMPLNNMGRTAKMDQQDTAHAIRYAVDNGADVINLSLGSSNHAIPMLTNALEYASRHHVVVLAAAGNEGKSIDGGYSAAGLAVDIPGLISVGNFRATDFKKSDTSNFGTNFVKLAAPGCDSQSVGFLTPAPDQGHSAFSGTSAATPISSAAAALAVGLVKSRGYRIDAGSIEHLLLDSAIPRPSLNAYFRGGRALNLASLAALIESRFPARSIARIGKN